MYIDMVIVNGMYRVSYIDANGQHQFRVFINKGNAKSWIVNNLRVID